MALVAFPPTLFGGGGVGVEPRVLFGGIEGVCDIVSMGWKRVNTTWGVGGGVGGSRYHTKIPNVKLGKLRVAMIGLPIIPDGGKRKVIMWTKNEP